MSPEKRKKLQMLADDPRTPENERAAAQNALDSVSLIPARQLINHRAAFETIRTKIDAEGLTLKKVQAIDIDVNDQGMFTLRVRGEIFV